MSIGGITGHNGRLLYGLLLRLSLVRSADTHQNFRLIIRWLHCSSFGRSHRPSVFRDLCFACFTDAQSLSHRMGRPSKSPPLRYIRSRRVSSTLYPLVANRKPFIVQPYEPQSRGSQGSLQQLPSVAKRIVNDYMCTVDVTLEYHQLPRALHCHISSVLCLLLPFVNLTCFPFYFAPDL